MNKQEFVEELRKGLKGLPDKDIEERVNFYSEMIDDRMEEGVTEAEAINEFGTAEEIVSQIMSEIPSSKLVKDKVKPRRTLRAWEIVLIVLGSPIWLSLLLTFLAVVVVIYVVFWSCSVALWAIDVSVMVCSLIEVLYSIVLLFKGNVWTGAAILGMGLICAGISIFGFFGCQLAERGVVFVTKKTFSGIKSWFGRKG